MAAKQKTNKNKLSKIIKIKNKNQKKVKTK